MLLLKFIGTHLANIKTELLSRELLPSTFTDWLYKRIASFITLQEKKKMVKKQDVAALTIYTGVLNVGFSGSKSVQVRLNMYSFKYTNKNLTRQFSYGVA